MSTSTPAPLSFSSKIRRHPAAVRASSWRWSFWSRVESRVPDQRASAPDRVDRIPVKLQLGQVGIIRQPGEQPWGYPAVLTYPWAVGSSPSRPGPSAVLCRLSPGVGRISSRIGWKILPRPGPGG